MGRLPEKFVERLEVLIPDFVMRERVLNSFEERPTTFRVNSLKARLSEVRKKLEQFGFQVAAVSWSKQAFVLVNRSKAELMELDIYKEGKIYIQSLASQICPLFLDVKSKHKVLDMTAAPGSKTSQIASLMGNQGELVANDVNKVRFFKLKHNLEHLGVENVQLECFDGSRLASFEKFQNYFDRILLDAPCSAEARFRVGKIKSFGFWSEKKIKAMAKKQRKLLYSAFRTLKVGGKLVYSTCTLAPEENEMLIQKFLLKNPQAKLLKADIEGVKKLLISQKFKNVEFSEEVLEKTLRIMPNKEMESFFVAVIQKV